jgi:hypothetical protein
MDDLNKDSTILIISQDNRSQVSSTSHDFEDFNQDSTDLVISQDNKLQVSSTSRKMHDLNNDSSKIKIMTPQQYQDCGAKQYYMTRTQILNLISHEIMRKVNII